jgi:glycosyltransferase involved in cell wall biosynthesis
MKKKIIIFMPSIEGGGVEKNLFLVCNYLSEKIRDLRLITISKKYKKKFNKSIKFITLSSNFWDKLSRRSKYVLALILLLKEILKDRNTIVFSFQANIYCIILCKLFFIKVISRSNSAPVGWSKNPFKRFIFKIFLNLADKIMVNSYEFKKELRKEFNVNSLCIYNPLNKKEIIKKSKNKSEKIFKTNNLKIINIGRFTDQKDQLTLLKALNFLKNKIKFEVVIIGRGALKKKLFNYITENNLNKFVKLKNFANNPFPLIKQADLFILSSKYEGLPNVLLESLVLNKYVISSKCRTGPKEILLDGKGGDLFKVGDYKKLSKLIINFNLRKKINNKKLKYAKDHLYRFDYDINLKKYLNLVNSVSKV